MNGAPHDRTSGTTCERVTVVFDMMPGGKSPLPYAMSAARTNTGHDGAREDATSKVMAWAKLGATLVLGSIASIALIPSSVGAGPALGSIPDSLSIEDCFRTARERAPEVVISTPAWRAASADS